MRKAILLLCRAVFFFLLVSCSRYPAGVERALKLAGDNRAELEKVLRHYSRHPEDSLKYRAACFLIENMTGHFSVDPEWNNSLLFIYDRHEAISEKWNWVKDAAWGREIDSLAEAHRNLYKTVSMSSIHQDIRSIKPDWLIENIELAFKAWQENLYTKNYGFDFFCEYLLPYRFMEGILLDDSRTVFYGRHAGIFNREYVSITAAVDSLLINYQDIIYSDNYGASIPVYNRAAVEKMRRVTCDNRTWFNALICASLGMAVSIDFMPAQGNRNGSHSFTTVVAGDSIHPFDPFYTETKWNLIEIYDNTTVDRFWGKFRLAKVYRHTFSINRSGPLFDPSAKNETLPLLFRNPRIRDVSHYYFDTASVVVPVPERTNVNGNRYAYLCVYKNRSLEPVQYGKIANGQVCFEGMGKDIVYMAAFMEADGPVPFGEPFYLDYDGRLHYFTVSDRKGALSVNAIRCQFNYDTHLRIFSPHWNTRILAVSENGTGKDTLHVFEKLDLWGNVIPVESAEKYRYIDLHLPSDTVALNELVFYTMDSGKERRIPDVKLVTPLSALDPSERVEMIGDNLSATGFRGVTTRSSSVIRFDLGAEYSLSKINYIPYTESMLREGSTYKLYYWDREWRSVDGKEGNEGFLTFENVPLGTIYRLEPQQDKGQKNAERIFFYEDGIVRWM